MKTFLATAAALALAAGTAAFAAGDLSRTNVQTVTLEMGTNEDGMFFSPKKMEFETGQAYKLVMTNVDEIKHEVALGELFERIFTRKLEIADKNGDLIAEVKGPVYEVEIGPGWTVEWFFVPVQTEENAILACELPGHKEAGMWNTVTLK